MGRVVRAAVVHPIGRLRRWWLRISGGRRRPDPRWTLFLYTVLCAAYLALGSLIFVSFEGLEHQQSITAFSQYLIDFRRRFPCVPENELEELIRRVVEANERGIKTRVSGPLEPSWSFGQAFFFCGTLVSTVGYGQISPTTSAGKAFTIFYCVFGIPMFLVLLTGFVSHIKAPAVWLLNKLRAAWGHLYSPTFIQMLHLIIITVILIVLLFIIPAAILMSIEKNWTFLDAFYYCFVSLTTIGLGDYIPGDQPDQKYRSAYKIFVTIYLMIGLVGMMLFLSVVYDIPQLNVSKFFFKVEAEETSEEKRLKQQFDSGPTYTRQIDEPEDNPVYTDPEYRYQ